MSSVTLTDVSMRFPSGAFGLADISLDIADGEFVALVGPSGSGKTTLLRTIAGFLAPTHGTVRIGDAVVSGDGTFVQPEHRGLGMVFQQHAVWPHWNVAKNVEYPLKRMGVARAERARRVSEALELVGLPGSHKRDPATLSGGQRQRVALARALVSRPQVLLLDEALSALDEPLRDSLRLELKTLTAEQGLSVVHVTHDRAEALALADRVVVLESGRVQQIGAPAAVIDRPASAFVARFLSDATLVEGTVCGGTFRASALPLTVDHVDGVTEGAVTAAILPEDIEVHPDPAGLGRIRSSLFTRTGSDVVVDLAGTALRARTSNRGLQMGDSVAIMVRSARTFAPAGVQQLAPVAVS